jgi:hypothetical protein
MAGTSFADAMYLIGERKRSTDVIRSAAMRPQANPDQRLGVHPYSWMTHAAGFPHEVLFDQKLHSPSFKEHRMVSPKTLRLESTERFPLSHRHDDEAC